MTVHLNWGKLFAWSQVALCLAASGGYLATRHYAKGLYWFFAG